MISLSKEGLIHRLPIVVLLLFSTAPHGASAQDRPVASCPETVGIPGGTNPEDRTIHRCRLDNEPRLVSPVAAVPSPFYARQTSAALTVVVDSDGRVNRRLTRYLLGGEDDDFQQMLLDRVRKWEFEAGTVNGSPVRYGFRLEVQMGIRRDTVPEQLRWHYIRGGQQDSLVGSWVPVPSDPAHTGQEFTSAAVRVTRVLREMQVLTPQHLQPYCLLLDQQVSSHTRSEVLLALYGDDLMSPTQLDVSPDCERDVTARRYRVASPLRTGGGRTVIRASGDFLQNWPPGLDRRWWRAWTAYCVVPDAEDADHGTTCEITPVRSGERVADHMDRYLAPPEPAEGSPVAFSVEVTTGSAFRTDTLHGAVPRILNSESQSRDAPHLFFRFGDLREEARNGGWFFLRLRLDRDIEGVDPVLRIMHMGRTTEWRLKRQNPREFDLSLNYSPAFSDETEFALYFDTTGGPSRR